MKILVITDSHLHLDNIIKMYEIEQADIVLCAGDHSKDAEELSFIYNKAKFYIVNGNCDFYDQTFSDEEIIDISNFKILLTHGHMQYVKSGYDELEKYAASLNVNLVVFGHTHKTYLKQGKLTLFNPGAAKDGKYGIIVIENNKIKIEQKQI